MSITFNLYRNFDGTLDGRYKQGDKPTAASGGTPALAWSAPQGLSDGNTITITTDGTYNFGNDAPQIVLLMDAADYALGQADGSEIQQGSAALTLSGGDFQVEADATLPAGKGWQMGKDNIGTKVTATFSPSTRIFESQTYYYSAQNIENSRTEYAASGGAAWQMKPVWFGSGGAFGGEDTGTNFFTVRPCINGGTDKRANSYISTNNGFTTYFTNSGVDNPADVNNFPYPVPYTMESLWDQGSADGVTLDGSLDYYCTASNGLASSRATATGLRLSANASTNKIIDGFGYGSYFIGMNPALDCHLLDTEFYCAVGDGAACRVAITNHADYFQASKRTVLWTNSWSSNSIEVKARNGWFDLANPSGLYLNILSASNQQIGSITLGDGAEGAPVISGFSGSFGQGNTLTLNVSNVTTKNSTQLVFAVGDSTENGNDATALLTQQPVANASNYKHTTSDSFMGSGASLLAQMQTGASGSIDPVIDLGSPQSAIYYSSVAKFNINTAGLDSESQQLKMQRINADVGGHSLDPNYGRTFFWATDDTDITSSQGTLYTGAGYAYDPADRRLWELGLLGKWLRTQIYWKASDLDTANGSLWFMDTNETDGVDYISGRGPSAQGRPDLNNPDILNPSDDISTWPKTYIPLDKHITRRAADSAAQNMQQVWLPFFKRESAQVDVFIDGIYVNNSLERVELGNAATWEACTKRAVQKQTSRQSSSIAFECYEAQFSASDDVYVFVFNEFGDYSEGYLIRSGAL